MMHNLPTTTHDTLTYSKRQNSYKPEPIIRQYSENASAQKNSHCAKVKPTRSLGGAQSFLIMRARHYYN